jgi:hypothetical protein
MKSLVVTGQRTNEENAFIEITVVRFCRALSQHLQERQPRPCNATQQQKISHANDDSGLGSHFFVLQTQPRHSIEVFREIRKYGMFASLNWNNRRGIRSSDAGGAAGQVDAVVWDISRPSGVTYKLETS